MSDLDWDYDAQIRPVIVEWIDAHSGSGGSLARQDILAEKIGLITTCVGILVRNDEQGVVLSQQTWTRENGSRLYRDSIYIPRVLVKSVTDLRAIDEKKS